MTTVMMSKSLRRCSLYDMESLNSEVHANRLRTQKLEAQKETMIDYRGCRSDLPRSHPVTQRSSLNDSLEVKSMKSEDVLVVKLEEKIVTVEETVNEEVALGTVATVHHDVKLIVKDLPVEGGCGRNAHSIMLGVATGPSNTELEAISPANTPRTWSALQIQVDRPKKCTSGHDSGPRQTTVPVTGGHSNPGHGAGLRQSCKESSSSSKS